ncbi:MAG: NAD-dependent epimerase/dehydratase family protein, partial [Planctomycetaceae bacterium]|nr:NAD-dependent epimerase/dehydratase family protein [Planctomycetaceae bacterium]
TGGAGFIGSHLVDALVDHGDDVVVMDDLSGGFKRNVPTGDALLRGSVSREQDVAAAFADGPFDVVFHLAAYAAEGLSHHIKRFNYENNLVGSVNLINAAVNADVGHFVFLSSAAVYGHATGTLTELDLPEPIDSYGIAKLAVEAELAVTERLFGLPYTIFRPHNVYGPYQNIGDRYRNVVGIFMNRLMRGEPLPVFGNGEQKRAFTDIRDVAPGIARAPFVPESRNQVFNVGSDRAVTVNELAQAVAKAFGETPRIEYLPAREEVELAWADHSKFRSVFAPGPEHSLEEGIQHMANWARQVGPRSSSVFTQVELTKHLPPSWAAALPQSDDPPPV